MAEIVIETNQLSKRYGQVLALDQASLSVQRGEVFGFLGPNGSGKTTTIGMLLGLLHPTSGSIQIFGQAVSPEHIQPLRKVGSLVGAPGLIPHLSGRDNLRLLARLNGVGNEQVESTLSQVGMLEAAGRKYRAYSMGMKQRLGLAASLLHSPELLILDEPTNGLDPAGMREIRDLLRQLAATGVTVFLSSHLLNEVEQVCDRVAVLRKGKVVATGKVSELLGQQKVVKVWIDKPQTAAIALQGLPGVTSVEPNGTSLQVEGVSSQEVIKHLVDRDMVPYEVTYRQTNLENVFLELTEGDI